MNEDNKEKVDTTSNSVVSFEPFMINKTFDASAELMFKVWTEAEHMTKWFGPKGIDINTVRRDFRPGGTYHYTMKTPDNAEMWGFFFYREIVQSKKIVWLNSFNDPEGALSRYPMGGAWPLEMLTTVSFNETDGKTLVKIEWLPINCTEDEIKNFAASRANMTQQWNGTFALLEEYLTTLK